MKNRSSTCNSLGIGGKADPARLIFSTKTGPGIVASLIDLGDRFRLLVNTLDTVKTPHDLPKLPVANAPVESASGYADRF